METYTEPKALADNPDFQAQRRETLAGLDDGMIDSPIIEIVKGINSLPYCFTLQCCYGHFIYSGRKDPHSFEALPVTGDIERVLYRIAYIAFCVENSVAGKLFMEALRGLTVIDPENIQFCCAEWFWERHVNSYALQVEPDRLKDRDEAVLDHSEALKIEKIRNEFYTGLKGLILYVQEHGMIG
ncbi:MAG: hypothetical protein JW746_09835 [Candidatus Krumholzibacteriota bacterium]|nr:hypothetical protein [Candidatus Krumholzibacteriota bacterium]